MKCAGGTGVRDEACREGNVVRMKFGVYRSEFWDFKAAAPANVPVAMARIAASSGSPGPVVSWE